MIFLGVQDITAKSLPIALVAGVAQFVQASMTIPKPAPRVEGETPSMKEEFTRNMQMQMRYVMPLLIFFIAYTLSAAIAIYFTVSALMAIGQEYVVKRYR